MMKETLVEQSLAEIARSVEGGTLSSEQAEEALRVLQELKTRVFDFDHLFRMQQERLGRAVRIYRRAHALPVGVYPDLAQIIDWLLDRSGRKAAQAYRGALLEALQRLDALGDLDFDEQYVLGGEWLLELRTFIRNAVIQGSDDEVVDQTDSASSIEHFIQ